MINLDFGRGWNNNISIELKPILCPNSNIEITSALETDVLPKPFGTHKLHMMRVTSTCMYVTIRDTLVSESVSGHIYIYIYVRIIFLEIKEDYNHHIILYEAFLLLLNL